MATSSTSAMSTGAEDRQKVWELIQDPAASRARVEVVPA